MRLLLKCLFRLVEADVAVAADAEKLQINAAQRPDQLVVTAALRLDVLRHAVRDVCVCLVDVDVVEQVGVHEVAVALLVVACQALVLVQVNRADLAEIQVALLVPLDQLLVGADRRRARGKPQHTVRLHNDLCGNDVGRLAAEILVISCDVNSHDVFRPP